MAAPPRGRLGRLDRQPDGVPPARNRGRRLKEDDRRLGRRIAAHLPHVARIILADRDDLAGQDRRQQPHVGEQPTGPR